MAGMIFQLVCLLSRAKTRRELSLSLYSPPIDGIYSADGVRAMEVEIAMANGYRKFG